MVGQNIESSPKGIIFFFWYRLDLVVSNQSKSGGILAGHL